MRALEVAVLDPRAGEGAIRVASMISLRRRVGVKDCRTIPTNPQLYNLTYAIIINAFKSHPPASSAFTPSIA
jgi:hypothetical protein